MKDNMKEYYFYTLIKNENGDIELEEKAVLVKDSKTRITDPDGNCFPHSYRWTVDKIMLGVVDTQYLHSDCVCAVVLDECNKDRAASIIKKYLNNEIERLLSEVETLTELRDDID